jgi:hypothetical protein
MAPQVQLFSAPRLPAALLEKHYCTIGEPAQNPCHPVPCGENRLTPQAAAALYATCLPLIAFFCISRHLPKRVLASRACTIYLIDGASPLWYSFNQPNSPPGGETTHCVAPHSSLE